jgi:hypothetical protein
MNAPSPHPFLLRLARLLLARAERSTACGPVRLPLDRKAAPELHDAPDADQLQLLRMQLDDLCDTNWVVLRLEPSRACTGLADRKPRLELLNFEALAAWAGYTPQAQRWQQRWREHLAAHWAAHPHAAPADSDAVFDYLARNPLAQMEGLPLEDATRSLTALATLCRSSRPMALREACAQIFQGRSKLLDHREELLRLLGASPGQFTESPIQLLLAPPEGTTPDPDGFADALFIENLATFEHMADVRAPAWARSLLIYAAGFRGSARRLRSRAGCRLYLRAPAPAAHLSAIEVWLFEEEGDGQQRHRKRRPMYFFGDLDYAGMQILASLREVFPAVAAWRPGYSALARQLTRGGGHPPALAAKELQTDPGNTGCTYADDELLALLRKHGRFIDQEAFDPAQTSEAPKPAKPEPNK